MQFYNIVAKHTVLTGAFDVKANGYTAPRGRFEPCVRDRRCALLRSPMLERNSLPAYLGLEWWCGLSGFVTWMKCNEIRELMLKTIVALRGRIPEITLLDW